ncbi:ABC transporter ATP-binding protein [Desulfobotulus mexicanus]|uniref:ATP-binding cassette domain-containing protein n=1 Tax=Desulfobotulus mexicanus TaxID=2586642 RepID=A0A5S5MC55_9BACT|nr:ATP-binding cassette domain-containing protein [Desulfobotulus mexicanus]TYT73270.1 ATP-binding cassette domain-containing protein [Desulfobotulus mexicanus]
METPLIRLVNVHKSFSSNPVLRGVSLDIMEGKTTAIIGKSGEGKSVLLKHIIGLMQPDEGEILYREKPIKEMSREETRIFRNKMSYMFQGCALFDSLSIFENIALPLKEGTRLSPSEIKEKVGERLKQLDLEGTENQYPSQISGGMMKRVAMARALVTSPELVLFDEPTTGLDPIRKNAVHRMIANYQKELGFTALVVSHEIPDIFHIAQEIIMLDEGQIVFSGSSEDIQACETPVVRQFLLGEADTMFID